MSDVNAKLRAMSNAFVEDARQMPYNEMIYELLREAARLQREHDAEIARGMHQEVVARLIESNRS